MSGPTHGLSCRMFRVCLGGTCALAGESMSYVSVRLSGFIVLFVASEQKSGCPVHYGERGVEVADYNCRTVFLPTFLSVSLHRF